MATNLQRVFSGRKKFLKHFTDLKKDRFILPNLSTDPVDSKEDSVKITGTSEFVDTVLSHLKDFLDYENVETKIVYMYDLVVDEEENETFFECRLKVKERTRNEKVIASYVLRSNETIKDDEITELESVMENLTRENEV